MLFTQLRRFRSETRGAAVLEAVIITPVLIWVYVGSFVFFDAFRTYSNSVRATYAVADVISREQNNLTPFDLDGVRQSLCNHRAQQCRCAYAHVPDHL